MKIRTILFLLLGLSSTLVIQSCLRDRCSSTQNYVRFDPIFKTVSECRSDMQVEAPRPLKKPGKIYSYGTYLFINEKLEGIHVIDNSNPESPTPIAFYNIPGNVDMAILGNHLYADQYMDLLSIDISNLQAPQVVCRREDEFGLLGYDPIEGYIVDYEETNVTEEVDCASYNWGRTWFFEGDFAFINSDMLSSSSFGSVKAQAGISGSFARFALYDHYLYTVDNSDLNSYDLSDPSCPSQLSSIVAGWNIETIFPWKNMLFLGSQNAVWVYDNTNPAEPEQLTVFWHATGCDPVVCDEDYAYVTVHDGTTCNGSVNQLNVVSIDKLPDATLFASYEMKRPLGLAVTENYLYLCDDGLKIYDKQNPGALEQLSHLSNIESYDVIALDETHLMLIGPGGFYQFDVTDGANPVEISHIPVHN
ncbi:MAG: hypothetical protein R2792_00615 [Saprospiraceae bacterium]